MFGLLLLLPSVQLSYTCLCREQESNVNRFLNQLPEAERFELVILNPTTVLGPLLTREVRSTAEITYHLMAGNLPLVPHWGTGGALVSPLVFFLF